jgi:hypothetical protein
MCKQVWSRQWQWRCTFYTICKSVETTIRKEQARKKKSGDEPIQAVIHIHMELPQGNSLLTILNKQEKISFFFFHNIREQEGGTSPACWAGTSGRWEEVGKECGKVNIVQILVTHVYKWKNGTC